MSYKCAILGHNYGDAEVERDREEDGNEVVITVREIETCTRCDDTQIVSENKEVTTLETAADIVADDLDQGASSAATDQHAASPPSSGSAEGEASVEEPGRHDTEIPEAESTVPEAESTVPEEAADPETDDGVILDDGDDVTEGQAVGEAESAPDDGHDDSGGRAPGEWPDEDPTEERRAEGAAEWPDEDDENDTPDWELPSDIDPHPETEHTIERTAGDALTVPEGTFYCPECEFTTPVESSSLRAGDFCPECHKGSLEHQHD